jgi:hypothetical protein
MAPDLKLPQWQDSEGVQLSLRADFTRDGGVAAYIPFPHKNAEKERFLVALLGMKI